MNVLKLYNEAKTETVALVPGSFKPPTAGHWDMITKYSKKADRVIVMISKPNAKSERPTNIGTKVSVQDAIKIFKLYNKSYGLNNVEFIESTSPSPVKAAYDYAELELKDVNVIFGASTKDGDYQRWKSVTAYMTKNNPSITVIDPKSSAVAPLASGGKPISASNWRSQVDNLEAYKDFVPKKLNDKDIQKVFNTLN
jgi:cytidyltransferase-like protein